MSGRLDSNQRPPEPHSGALAKLRHAPIRGSLGTATYNVDVLLSSVKAAPSLALRVGVGGARATQ
jgi:hypothetical protein